MSSRLVPDECRLYSARRKLVVIGDSATLTNDPFIRTAAQMVRKHRRMYVVSEIRNDLQESSLTHKSLDWCTLFYVQAFDDEHAHETANTVGLE